MIIRITQFEREEGFDFRGELPYDAYIISVKYHKGGAKPFYLVEYMIEEDSPVPF